MRKIKTLFVLSICLFSVYCEGQNWDYISADFEYDGRQRLKMVEGGFVTMNLKGLDEVSLTKINYDGEFVWETKFSGQTGSDFFELANKDILLVSKPISSQTNIIILDSLGNILTSNILSETTTQNMPFPLSGNSQVILKENGSFALYTSNINLNEINFSIIEFSTNAEISTFKNYSANIEDNDITPEVEGGLDIFGTINNSIEEGFIITSGYPEMVMAKIDSNGDVEWWKFYNYRFIGNLNRNRKAFPISSGFIVVNGRRIIKINNDGDIEWIKNAFFIEGDLVFKNSNEIYGIGGTKEFSITEGEQVREMGIIKFDSTGTLLSSKMFLDNFRSYGGDILLVENNKIIGTRKINCYPCQFSTFEIEEVEVEGIDSLFTGLLLEDTIIGVTDLTYEVTNLLTSIEDIYSENFINSFSVFPNPSFEELNLEIVLPKKNNFKIRIYDSNGKEWFLEEYSDLLSINKSFSILEVPTNVLFVEVILQNQRIAKKVIKVRR